ncbi:hypothetical protein [Rhizobium phage RHEph24]|nr:hypothetical protein [Rhizobium phage RHEph24]
MFGWFKNWWERTMVMDMTKDCNDGSWESGFYTDDAGIRSVEQPSAEIIKFPDREHELTMIQVDMDSWTERRLDDIWEQENRL